MSFLQISHCGHPGTMRSCRWMGAVMNRALSEWISYGYILEIAIIHYNNIFAPNSD